MLMRMKAAVAATLGIALAIGGGPTLLGPALAAAQDTSPSAEPSAGTSPTPVASPAASPASPAWADHGTLLVEVPWRLVGHGDGAGGYVSPLSAAPADLWFPDTTTFTATTGCREVAGTYERPLMNPMPTDGTAIPTTFAFDVPEVTCLDTAVGQDAAIIKALQGAGATSLTKGGPDELAPGVTAATLDPVLAAHYTQNPDLTRLVIRDQSGEGTLIYAALAAEGPTASGSPAPSAPPAPAFLQGDQVLPGTLWRLVGWVDGTGRYTAVDPAVVSTLRFTNCGGERRFSADGPCWPIRGTYRRGAARPDNPTRTIRFSVAGRDELPTCPADVTLLQDAILEHIRTARGSTLGVQGSDSLAPSLDPADLDPALAQHFADHPELTRLILRDRSGEGVLIYAPVAG